MSDSAKGQNTTEFIPLLDNHKKDLEGNDEADGIQGNPRYVVSSSGINRSKRQRNPPDIELIKYTVKSNEIIAEETGTHNAEELTLTKTEEQSLMRQSTPDQIDNVSVLGNDADDVENEPSFSWDNPAVTEEYVEASHGPDNITQTICFFHKSSWIEKKFNKLLLAVTYEDREQMNRILKEEEPSTLVQLLTKRDAIGDTCIMKAIHSQSFSCIQPLLEQLKSLDGFDKMDALQSDEKRNILHVAAQTMRDMEILNTIDNYPWMEQLADRTDYCGRTPLIVACQHQNHAMARRLVSYQAKIDHVDKDYCSPIYWATASGSAKILKLLLVHGARDANHQSELFKNPKLYKREGTILHAILESKSSETLQVCLEIGNGKDDIIECFKIELDSDTTFIYKVYETPLVNLVKLAIEGRELDLDRLDEDDVTFLMKATEARQLDIVKLILSTNSGRKTLSFQKRSTKETALMIACKKGFHEIVEFIMENSDKEMHLDELDRDKRNVFHHSAKDEKILPVLINICRGMEKYKNYKDYLKLQDNDGYVSLHYAATSGSHKNVKLLLENDVPYKTPSASFGRTALHYSACSNLSTVKALLEFLKKHYNADEIKQYIDAADSSLQTSLHIAASLGKWQTVSYLLENGATMKCDREEETALHLAAASGCKRTVQALIQNSPSMVNKENLVGETPAMFAAVSGETDILQMLLDNNATLWAPNHERSEVRRKTCLDWAVMNNCLDVVKAILKRENWKDVMNKSEEGPDGLLARMVEYMPSVAIEVLDKCEEKQTDQKVKYDFFALQEKKVISFGGGKRPNYVKLEALKAMAYHSRMDCLNHAVVRTFLKQKWSHRVGKWITCWFFIYTAFLISFSTYIMLVMKGRCPANVQCMIFSGLSYLFAGCGVIKEFFQLWHRRFQYFCMVSTYLDLIMYISVFIFLTNDEKNNRQRQAGAIAIFLAWINSTWFLQLTSYGTYIIMAKKIIVTFLHVLFPVSFFIVAFSSAFFVLLHNEDDDFKNIWRSLLTSFAMMAGDVDFRDTFVRQTRTHSNFVLILMFSLLFVVVMSILLMNLLNALAVGDVGEIMRKSSASKQIEQAMLIVEMDDCLGHYPWMMEATFIPPLTISKRRRFQRKS